MGTASHLALARLASRPLIGGTRKHLILGGDPSQPGSLTPTRYTLSDRGITQHSGATKAHQHRTLSLRQPAAFNPDVSQLVQAASVNSRSLTHLAKDSGPHRHTAAVTTPSRRSSVSYNRAITEGVRISMHRLHIVDESLHQPSSQFLETLSIPRSKEIAARLARMGMQ